MSQITSVHLRAEPKFRKDRKCVIAECRKPIPLVGVQNNDPFCSNKCCKQFYGVVEQPGPYTRPLP